MSLPTLAFNPKNPFIVLGSSSSARQQVLKTGGYNYCILKPDIDEYSIGDRTDGSFENAGKLVTAVGDGKADTICNMIKGNPLLIQEHYQKHLSFKKLKN